MQTGEETSDASVLAAYLAYRRPDLVARLVEASRGRPWAYVLFGSLVRGDVHRDSDADVCICLASTARPADVVAAWAEARRVCLALGFRPDVRLFEDLPAEMQQAVLGDGLVCTA